MVTPLPDPSKIDLRERKSREKLAKLVASLLEHWQLSPADQAALLGLSAQSRSTVARYRRGEPLGDSADLIARAGHLLGIHKALRIMFPHDRELADPAVGGLAAVRKHDAQRLVDAEPV